MRYKNGESFLSSLRVGKGTIYLAASPLEEEYTNLQRHSIFVPLMYKIAFNSIVSSERLSHSFQESAVTIALEEEKEQSNSVYTLVGKDFNVIPAQWRTGGKLVLDLPSEQMQAGFYELQLNGKTKKILAVNYDKKESKLSLYSTKDLAQMTEKYKNVKIYDTETSAQFADSFSQDNIGKPLWKYFLLGSLLFLLIEIALIRFL